MKMTKTTLVFMLSILAAQANAESKQVILTAYQDSQSYQSSAFNFEKMSQDGEVTRNRFNILYQPSNEISTETVVGDFGAIADLGETSCEKLPTQHEAKGSYPGKGHGGYPYSEDRKLDPMFWLSYSSAWTSLSVSRESRIKPVINHCYLLHLTGYDGITIAMFHVKDLVPGKMLVIDEMELFKRAEFVQSNQQKEKGE